MPKRYLGRAGAIEQGKEYSGGPGVPTKTIRTWKGPKEAVRNMVDQVLGFVWTLREDGPSATLTVEEPNLPGGTGSTSAVLDDSWELLPGEIEKDILESDLVGIAALTDAEKRVIRHAIETSATSLPTSPTLSSFAQKVYALMLTGVRARVQFAPRLRHTQTVSTLYTVKAGVTNTGRILSSTYLVSTEGLPSGFLIALNAPPFTNTSVWTNPDLEIQFGWLKYYPTLNSSAGGRLQIVQEWAFGLWSTLLYGAVL